MINFINTKENILATIATKSFKLDNTEEMRDYLKAQQAKVEMCESAEAYDTLMTDTIEYLEKITAKDYTLIEERCNGLLLFKDEKYYLKSKSGLVSSIAMPEILVEKLQWAVDTNNDPMPLVKLWTRWMRNPNFSEKKTNIFFEYITAENIDHVKEAELIEQGYTEEDAKTLATYNDVSITNEGLLVCKKYAQLVNEKYTIDPETNEVVCRPIYDVDRTVNEVTGEVTEEMVLPNSEELEFMPPVQRWDGDKFTADGQYHGVEEREGHIIKIGAEISLEEWSQVNCNDDSTCVPGLHVGKI